MSGARGLLLDRATIARRRELARGPLAPLAASLAADLAIARDRELFVPSEKARMTRVGGRCARDGALLAFDPFAPRAHRCASCGATYDGDEHHRWWIFWYQLWLAERAVHGAALSLLAHDAAAGAYARDILEAYVERYLRYPNRDNVLGPTRPFFSTYLESIWLLQLCVAIDLLEAAGEGGTLGARLRDRVIEPSRALVAGFDEGASNRQVWNAAALAAAARVLGDDVGFERAVLGRSGVASHLRGGLLADGTWYEGENYHQFAHRGLWYGVTLAELGGLTLPADLLARFAEGFVAPFQTALPDLTLPARRDSQWAISLRQWRWAESCELGLARRDDERLAGTLAALYDREAPVPRRDTGRWRTAAESERNEPPTSLGRADLGWRSLLHARATVPTASRWAPASVLLAAQGIAVFRRDRGTLWTALDYGASGGGHGHPDRLDVLLADGSRRLLDDMGTGSYVERTLHWYRSTLAHNAPLVDGRSQARVDGRLLAHDERDAWGWAHASAPIAAGVEARRALVVGPDYAIDRLVWRADRDVALDLPIHLDAAASIGGWRAVEVRGAGGLEDGFDFLADVRAATVAPHELVRLDADPAARAWIGCSAPAVWHAATAPAAPGKGTRRFHFVRVRGAGAAITSVWDPRGVIEGVELAHEGVTVRRVDRGVDRHAWAGETWQVASRRGDTALAIVLDGRVHEPTAARHAPAVAPAGAVALSGDGAHTFALGEAHYRRSEESWAEAGCPSAVVRVAREGGALLVRVDVAAPRPTFVPAGRENPLDNERPEINGDGVQLYLRPGGSDETLGWLLVPDEGMGDAVRVVALSPAAGHVPLAARWSREAGGYAVSVTIPGDAIGSATTVGFDVVVNETTPERERRRGQLILSGAHGEFVYLQGDRHDPARLLVLRLTE